MGCKKKLMIRTVFLKETFHLRLKRIRVILPHVQYLQVCKL